MKYAAIRSYQFREIRWSTHCEECGAEIESGYRSATSAREAWDNLREREGRALCDEHWHDPDDTEDA